MSHLFAKAAPAATRLAFCDHAAERTPPPSQAMHVDGCVSSAGGSNGPCTPAGMMGKSVDKLIDAGHGLNHKKEDVLDVGVNAVSHGSMLYGGSGARPSVNKQHRRRAAAHG